MAARAGRAPAPRGPHDRAPRACGARRGRPDVSGFAIRGSERGESVTGVECGLESRARVPCRLRNPPPASTGPVLAVGPSRSRDSRYASWEIDYAGGIRVRMHRPRLETVTSRRESRGQRPSEQLLRHSGCRCGNREPRPACGPCLPRRRGGCSRSRDGMIDMWQIDCLRGIGIRTTCLHFLTLTRTMAAAVSPVAEACRRRRPIWRPRPAKAPRGREFRSGDGGPCRSSASASWAARPGAPRLRGASRSTGRFRVRDSGLETWRIGYGRGMRIRILGPRSMPLAEPAARKYGTRRCGRALPFPRQPLCFVGNRLRRWNQG